MYTKKNIRGKAKKYLAMAVMTALYSGGAFMSGVAWAGTLPQDAQSTTVTSHTLTADETLAASIGVMGTTTFTLNGGGYTVNGNNFYGFQFISTTNSSTLTISNVTLQNFGAIGGSAASVVYNPVQASNAISTINVGTSASDMVIFKGNKQSPLRIVGANSGGGVTYSNSQAILNLTGNVVFDGNSGEAGAIYNHKAGSNKALTNMNGNTLFLNNTGTTGGAIYLLGGAEGGQVRIGGNAVFYGNKKSGTPNDIHNGSGTYLKGNVKMDGGISNSGNLFIGEADTDKAYVYIGGLKCLSSVDYNGTNLAASKYNVANYVADSSVASSAGVSAATMTVAANSMLDMHNSSGNLSATALNNSGAVKMGSGNNTVTNLTNNGVLDLSSTAKNTVTVSGDAKLNGSLILGYDLSGSNTDVINVTGTAMGTPKFASGFITNGYFGCGCQQNNYCYYSRNQQRYTGFY